MRCHELKSCNEESADLLFTWPDHRVGPMTWPQRAIWSVVNWEGENAFHRNVVRTWRFDEGIECERAINAFRSVIDYFETLRTVFMTEEDWPQQRLLESGVISARLHHTTSADLDKCTAALADQLRGPSFDLSADVPIRLGISAVSGRAFRVVVVISHVSIDETSAQILEEAYRAVVLSGESALEEYRDLSEQPIDRVGFEHSAAGERARTRTLNYWRKAFSEVPVEMSTGGLEAEARVERASILSPSAAQAISAITQRTGANSTAVIIGAYAGAIAASLNVSDVAVRSLVATRQRKVARRAVAALNLNGLFRVALPSDLTVDEYFLSAQISAHKAVVYSETNPAELESELDSIMDGRGVQIKQYIYFNDMSKSQIRRHGHIGGGGAEEGDLTGGPRGNGTQIRPIENHTPDKDSKLLLDVFSAYPKLDMNLYIDRRSVPVRSASFLRVLEQFIIESSLHPLSRLGSMVQLASSELDAT